MRPRQLGAGFAARASRAVCRSTSRRVFSWFASDSRAAPSGSPPPPPRPGRFCRRRRGCRTPAAPRRAAAAVAARRPRIDVQLGRVLRRATAEASTSTAASGSAAVRLVRLGDTPAARHARGIALHVRVLRAEVLPQPAAAPVAAHRGEAVGREACASPTSRMSSAVAASATWVPTPSWARDDRHRASARPRRHGRARAQTSRYASNSPRCALESSAF